MQGKLNQIREIVNAFKLIHYDLNDLRTGTEDINKRAHTLRRSEVEDLLFFYIKTREIIYEKGRPI